jgi:hypothetical protein
LIPFARATDLLKEVLPVGELMNAETVRNHLQLTAIYRYFAPQRRRMEARFTAERTAYRQAERKIGSNDL